MTLNVLPGLGVGYLYKRRWKADWVSSVLATTWFIIGAALLQGAEAAEELQNQLVGLGGLVNRQTPHLDAKGGSLLREDSLEIPAINFNQENQTQKSRKRSRHNNK